MKGSEPEWFNSTDIELEVQVITVLVSCAGPLNERCGVIGFGVAFIKPISKVTFLFK